MICPYLALSYLDSQGQDWLRLTHKILNHIIGSRSMDFHKGESQTSRWWSSKVKDNWITCRFIIIIYRHPDDGANMWSINIERWRSAKIINRAPDKIGNVNKSIPPVIKRDQGNNGIIFNVR